MPIHRGRSSRKNVSIEVSPFAGIRIEELGAEVAPEGRVISAVMGARDDLADVTHEDAAEAGVTRGISTIDDYILTATWAADSEQAGFTDPQYFPRFSTGRDTTFAVFGDAGAHAPPGFSIRSVTSLAEVLFREGTGVRLLPSAFDPVDRDVDDVDAR